MRKVIFSENDCLRTKLDLRLRKKHLTKTITKNKQAIFSNQFFSQFSIYSVIQFPYDLKKLKKLFSKTFAFS